MTCIPLFLGFARVGVLGFGGGPAMLPLLQAECVGSSWVTEAEFLEAVAIGSALPGPIAVKVAVYVGWQVCGPLGALVALVGIISPGALLMVAVGSVLARYREHPAVVGALRGVKPAVVGMLAFVAWDLAPAGITGAAGAVLALAGFAALVAGAHPGMVIAVAAIVGGLALRF